MVFIGGKKFWEQHQYLCLHCVQTFRFLCECTLVLLRVAYILPLYMMLANFPISRPVNV